MVIISKNKRTLWDSYILVIVGVLLLLNTYPLLASEDLVFRSKTATMQSGISVMINSLSGLDRLTEENVANAMAITQETTFSRIMVRCCTTPARPAVP